MLVYNLSSPKACYDYEHCNDDNDEGKAWEAGNGSQTTLRSFNKLWEDVNGVKEKWQGKETEKRVSKLK